MYEESLRFVVESVRRPHPLEAIFQKKKSPVNRSTVEIISLAYRGNQNISA